MRQLETLESRMLLSASAMPAALSTQVVMSPQTSYQLDKHGALQIKATGNLYAKVATVTKTGNVEVMLADDSGASADLKGVSSVAILESGKGGQTIDWQANGVNANILMQGAGDSLFVNDMGNDHTQVLVSGLNSSVSLDGKGTAQVLANGSSKTNGDTLNVNGVFSLTALGFETVNKPTTSSSSSSSSSSTPDDSPSTGSSTPSSTTKKPCPPKHAPPPKHLHHVFRR
jgi:hypothetical protein